MGRERWARNGALALGLAGVAALASAGRPAQPVHGSGPETVAPTGAAAEILRQSRDYRDWQRFSEYTAPKLSKTHSGNHVVAWYNAAAAPAARGDAAAYPDGSIIVKENRLTPDGPPASLSVMAKRDGGWFWISATPGGQVFAADGAPLAGDLGRCAGCHTAADPDLVFSR
jgi:hypothetical protein